MSELVEKRLVRLEKEAAAAKQSFQRAATSLRLFSKTLSFSTKKNETTIVYDGSTVKQADPERIDVFFDTHLGANTIATLQFTTSSPDHMVVVRRAKYSGGAKWTVTATANAPSGNWRTTKYNFRVQSFVDGSLRAEQRGF